MPCDEDCRTAVLGKTERTVGWEGDGEPATNGLLRHCMRGKPAAPARPALPPLSHSFTLDIVMGFQVKSDAERFWAELIERLDRFGLELHPEKTRLLAFGPYVAERCKRAGMSKPETFNFLGFTHICARKRSNGRFTVLRQTMRQRMQAKLNAVKVELRRRTHDPIPQVGQWLSKVVGGHIRYYGVPMNGPALHVFRFQVGRLWHRALCRRSQNGRITWERMRRLLQRWLPPVRVCHPYPLRRLGVIT